MYIYCKPNPNEKGFIFQMQTKPTALEKPLHLQGRVNRPTPLEKHVQARHYWSNILRTAGVATLTI